VLLVLCFTNGVPVVLLLPCPCRDVIVGWRDGSNGGRHRRDRRYLRTRVCVPHPFPHRGRRATPHAGVSQPCTYLYVHIYARTHIYRYSSPCSEVATPPFICVPLLDSSAAPVNATYMCVYSPTCDRTPGYIFVSSWVN